MTYDTGAGPGIAEPVMGWLTHPLTPPPWPVVLVIHAHGNRHDIGARELMEGRPAISRPLGPDLTSRGFAALCLDLPCFGARNGESESAAAKAALWQGESLAGRMLAELSAQVAWLSQDPRFDPGRIGVYGLSMGATLGCWLAAVEPRVAALAQLCCFADIGQLIESGAHDLHGLYLTVPGLPALARNGQIAGLVAPRPQLVCVGALDPLTPPDALDVAITDLRAAYAGSEHALDVLVEPETGHVETPAMRDRVMGFFDRTLN
ncbi:dienelactone hydrolase family protein [Roseicitreum antarcticum]|nr:dienelactone hydrolase family protein [Roseicitreum antarcticum]